MFLGCLCDWVREGWLEVGTNPELSRDWRSEGVVLELKRSSKKVKGEFCIPSGFALTRLTD